MTESQFLKEYGGQSLDELISMETTYRIDSLVLAIEAALNQKVAAHDAEALSPEERVILVVEALEREVNNGGYDQFFCNSGVYAGEIEAALRTIGCPTQAAIANRAIAALKIKGSVLPEAVEAAIYAEDEGRDEALGALDDKFYACEEPIADRLFAFVKANRAQIRLR